METQPIEEQTQPVEPMQPDTSNPAPVEPAPVEPTPHHMPRSRWAVYGLIGLIILAGVFRAGYVSGKKGFVFEPKQFKIVNQDDVAQNVDYSLLWKALDIVDSKYIDKDHIDQQKVLYGAIRGAVAAAGDEYTAFFDPTDLNDFKTQLQGSFSGIGAEVGKQNDNIVIIAPIDGSPAQKAGIQPKDIIVNIDGQSTADMSIDEAVSKIRGEKGTDVTLTLFREGKNGTFDVKITRDTIEIKSVKVDYKDVNGKQIAVISISRFGDDTKDLFDQAVKDIQSKNVAGIVVDLRNNPGGYLDTAVELASDWVPKDKLVVTEAHSDGSNITYNSKGYDRLSKYKTVLLVNGGSASASEILSGALKDNGIAQLIGEKTFGKGSVQELVPLSDDTAVKVTIAKWITPSGKNLNKDGLNPDIEVKLTDDDISNQRDPQLDRALQEAAK